MVLRHFQQLNERDAEEVVRVLEAADRDHQRWLRDLHASLICGVPFAEDVLREDAHVLCKFGQWYYQRAPQALRQYEAFSALDQIHRDMHNLARPLAQKSIAGEPVTFEDYNGFIELQTTLSRDLLQLRDMLQREKFSFDALTGALNREAFAPLLEQEYERIRRSGESGALCMMDLDHFKVVNDTCGHLGGDRVLRRVSEFLRQHLRKYDVICRYGGEEFLMLLPGVDTGQVLEILERVRRELAETSIDLAEGGVRVTASFGVTLLDPERSLEANLDCADQAMYEAKDQGRNRVVYKA